jgi:hypothetical protein
MAEPMKIRATLKADARRARADGAPMKPASVTLTATLRRSISSRR